MDLSELLLKVNKGQAVTQLKSVQTELSKTGSAADKLQDTLKNIGVSIGLAALVKQSLQLNNELTATERKFKNIFGGKFTGVKDLVEGFNLTDSSAKRVLSTIGQFTQGLGFASKASQELSLGLAKAATDWAAFSGSGNAEDVAKKFGKALTGETGELKDIGIIIDTQSESFKRLTEEVSASTGAIGAQAKAIAIQKSIIEQTGVASGAAAANIFDGFTLLKNTFENIKEILGKIGTILSVTFGPALNILNQLLSLQPVQWFSAFAISVGILTVSVSKLTAATASLTAATASLNSSVQVVKSSFSEVNEQINRMSNDKVKSLGNEFKVVAEASKMLENRELRLNTDAVRKELQTLSTNYNKNNVKPIELPATFQVGQLKTDTAKSFVTQLQSIDKTASSVNANLKQAQAFQTSYVAQINKLLNAQQAAIERFINIKQTGADLGFDIAKLSKDKEFQKLKEDLANSMGSHGVVDKVIELEKEYTATKKQFGVIKTDMRQVIADFQKLDLPVENIKFFQTFEAVKNDFSRLNMNNIETFDLSGVQRDIEMIGLLNKDFAGYMGPLEDVKSALANVTKATTTSAAITKTLTLAETALAVKRSAATKQAIANAAAEKALGRINLSAQNLKSFTGAVNGLQGKLKGVSNFLSAIFNLPLNMAKTSFSGITAAAKGAASASGAMSTAMSGLKAAVGGALGSLGGLLATLGTIAVYVVGIVAALSIIAMLIEGLIKWDWKEIFYGKVATALAGFLDGMWESVNNFFGGSYKSAKTLEKEAKELEEQVKKLNNLRIEIKGLNREKIQIVQDANWDEFLPSRQINILRGRAKNFSSDLNDITKEIFELEDKDSRTYKELVGDLTGNEATIKVMERIAELKKEENSTLRSQLEVENKIKDIKRQLYQAELDMFNKLQEFQHEYKSALTNFSFGYDDSGKFVNNSDKANVKELQRYLRSVKLAIGTYQFNGASSKQGLENLIQLRQKEFDTAREIAQARMDALNAERDAAIDNLKSMYDFLRSTFKFASTAQEAVSASSLKAIEYQSRRQDGINKTELAPIIENQKAVRTIETKMLRLQEESKDQLRTIVDNTKKTYERLRQNEGVILTVDPFR